MNAIDFITKILQTIKNKNKKILLSHESINYGEALYIDNRSDRNDINDEFQLGLIYADDNDFSYIKDIISLKRLFLLQHVKMNDRICIVFSGENAIVTDVIVEERAYNYIIKCK